MKINEFKLPDDVYKEEDINAVINQSINGEWEYMNTDQLINHIHQLTQGVSNENQT